MQTAMRRLIPGEPAPEMDVPLLQGGRWRLSEQAPENFTLIQVFRGAHCSFCKPEVEKLQSMMNAFQEIGISILSVSMDNLEHAQLAEKWDISSLPFAYALSEDQARSWGLYLSSRIKEIEPPLFAEPAVFLIDPKGCLYAEFQASAPWLRLDFDILHRGIQLSMQRGTPPRGTVI